MKHAHALKIQSLNPVNHIDHLDREISYWEMVSGSTDREAGQGKMSTSFLGIILPGEFFSLKNLGSDRQEFLARSIQLLK